MKPFKGLTAVRRAMLSYFKAASPATEHTIETIVYPNNEKDEIWFRSEDGRGFAIRVSAGPYGNSVQIRAFPGQSPITAISTNGDVAEDGWLECCQYKNDDKSQAFKRAYIKGDLSEFYREYPTNKPE